MYRAVTLFALRNNLINDGVVNANELHNRIGEVQIELKKNYHAAKLETFLYGEYVEETIRSLEVSSHVSTISTLAFVRKRLVELQQEMGNKGGIVMDGRDIGTVVFPNAHLKLFMTASAEIRAKRRYDEMIQKGDEVTFEEILENVVTRDRIDSTRIESPLKQADDALVLDNSHITPQEQLAWILKQLEEQGWM
jgi:cytidylate kinase